MCLDKETQCRVSQMTWMNDKHLKWHCNLSCTYRKTRQPWGQTSQRLLLQHTCIADADATVERTMTVPHGGRCYCPWHCQIPRGRNCFVWPSCLENNNCLVDELIRRRCLPRTNLYLCKKEVLAFVVRLLCLSFVSRKESGAKSVSLRFARWPLLRTRTEVSSNSGFKLWHD